MTYQEIDALFPFMIFFYGALLTLVLNQPQLMAIAEQKLPMLWVRQLQKHRYLALICLIIGSLWSLQSLWLN